MRVAGFAIAVVFLLGCGGPATVDPGPTQSVDAYFSGIDDSGALHVHVHFTQNRRTLTIGSTCPIQDECRIYPNSDTGKSQLGSEFAVDLASGSGTFADPGITFTVTTTNGKSFTFAGTVAESRQMVGTISGPTHPASRLQLDKQ
jgi:hypothetical protein